MRFSREAGYATLAPKRRSAEAPKRRSAEAPKRRSAEAPKRSGSELRGVRPRPVSSRDAHAGQAPWRASDRWLRRCETVGLRCGGHFWAVLGVCRWMCSLYATGWCRTTRTLSAAS
ncbi:hypothetical protein [Frankia sp. AgKG'84/4]|uniref:hypothetical protein n=1 Tax=Frankia sp. AgKG'84/4 TaxID=573490 RepID=UPI0035B0819C